MNTLRPIRFSILLCLAPAFVFPALAAKPAKPVAPTEQDRQVLEALLLHLLADRGADLLKFHHTAFANRATIVLHNHSPDYTGFLETNQIVCDIHPRTLPGEAERDLRQRNTPARSRARQRDSAAAPYTNLVFAPQILVTDLSRYSSGDWEWLKSFIEANPDAHGLFFAYLPGYTQDNNAAAVRALVGPSSHGATLTALLKKRDNKWVVEWYRFAFYA